MVSFALRTLRGPGSHFVAMLVALLSSGCGPFEDPSEGAAASASGCFPTEGPTVRWIVGASAGGGFDIYSRLLEPFYETAIGAEIVIENRAGAGGRMAARTIRDADPDGRTIGLVSAFSLFVWELSGSGSGLHPTGDFTVLGQVSPSHPVWLTSAESGYRSVYDLIEHSTSEPILAGVTSIGSTDFVSVSVAAALLGLDVAYLPGYPGSRETSMDLIRGEFDLLGVTFESILDRIESGDVIPVLQIADRPISNHPELAEVPLLGGADGLAAQVARQRGEDVERAVEVAGAVSNLFSMGRLVVGPKGLDPELSACLSDGLATAARDPGFVSAASATRREPEFADAATVMVDLERIEDELSWLAPILDRHAELLRTGASSR